MFKQASKAPTRKSTASALAGALTTILIWVFHTFQLLPAGTEISGEVAAAITTVLTFLVGYIVDPAARDALVEV